MEQDVQARFEQIEQGHRELEHMFTEYMAQAKQITAQHSTLLSRYDRLLLGDGQSSGTIVRMDRLEQSTTSLHKRLDGVKQELRQLAGRTPIPTTVIITILSSTCVGLLVSHFH